MGTKTKPFNPIEMLHTDEEIAELLAEAYEDEDPAVFVATLGQIVKHRGVANIAEATGLSRESMYRTLNGTTQPKWDSIHRILHALGVKLAIS